MKFFVSKSRYVGGLFVLALLMSFSGLVQAQGTVLTYGSVITAEVSAEAPIVIFPFTGTEGDQVTVRVFASTPDVQPTVSLFSPSQQQLATTSGSPFAPGLAELSYILPASGVYTVFVSSVNNTPGGFVVRLDGSAAPPSLAVDSETPATGNLSDAEPVQVFSVQAHANTPTMVTISSSTTGFAYSTAQRNAEGTILALFNGSDSSPVVATLPAGTATYTFEVRPTLSGTSGDVMLSLGTAADTTQPVATATPNVPAATPTSTAVPETTTCTGTTNNASNVRTGPSVDYSVIMTLQPGQTQQVIGVNSVFGWYVIALPDGTDGWVFGDLLTLNVNCDTLPEIPAPDLSGATATAIATATPVTATATTSSASSPTATATATSSDGQSPATFTPSATATTPSNQPTVTSQPTTTTQPTATFTPSYTPTTQPTATFTPSYTPTTPPPVQIAPEDPRFNNPLEIPLDNTTSVLDFVSYPDGDREDRVRYSVTGMNPNVAITGGRARLVISVSCFGENTDQIQFFTGGQTYTCGQTIVDREVTADSDTGSVVITAVGGEGTYVQWVLTGTATRVN